MFGLRKFFKDTKGTTAVTFSLCLTSVCIASGAAIDYGRLNVSQNEAYVLADAAALAGVGAVGTTKEAMENAAKVILDANAKDMNLGVPNAPKFDLDPATGKFTVTLSGKVGTSVMSIAGLTDMQYSVSSTAIRAAVPPIEMVLALDTTGSMAGTKITDLKSAASDMVKSVLKNKDAKVGIVPFSDYVNVGVSRRNMAYLNVPADYTKDVKQSTTTYPNKKGCKKVTTPKTCTGNNDGVPTTWSCPTTVETCDDWGTPLVTEKTVTNKYTFRGCVGSRLASHRSRIDEESFKYPGFLNVNCGTEIEDLTSTLGHLQSKIVQLSATGQTYLPSGLTWGWNMLNANDPLSTAAKPADLAAKGGKKVLVFMTDGANTLVPQNQNAGSHVQPTTGTYYKNVSTANTLTTELCAAIKKDGIEIYTVLFDVTDTALEKILQDCATNPAMSYKAVNSKQLVSAFEQIVADLGAIRITK